MYKNIFKITVISLLLLVVYANKSYSQSSGNFVFIESSVEDVQSLNRELANSTLVYFNDNPKPAMYIYSQILEGRTINDLFIYVETEPGVLKFKSGEITSGNINDYATELAGISQNVNTRIIIRSNDVFNGASGALLKEKLQVLTGLEVDMESTPQPFSN